jgi:lipid II:glycine glycyltransferase (peptidoglycan interpeptide bridge formation enzyme)
MDLGGVDTPAARRKPEPGEEMHGLLAFKEAFGGQWVEQSGNHEWVARPWRYALGRVLAAVARRIRR